MVYIRTNCIDTIQFDKLYVRFNLTNYNQYCIIEDKKSLIFATNIIYTFKFTFLPHKQDIGKDLEVNSISLEIGNREVRVLVMHWNGDCKNALTNENHTQLSFEKISSSFSGNKKIISSENQPLNWNEIKVLPNTRFGISYIIYYSFNN